MTAIPVTIRLFGQPEIADLADHVFFPAKGFQLIALLACSPSKQLSRREIASSLWDSETDAAAFANLRQLLVRMRKASVATAGLIRADGHTIILESGSTQLDRLVFERMIASPSVDEVVQALLLCRGDLLEGISDTTESFQDWLTQERGAARERFFAAASSALIELTRFGRAPVARLQAIAAHMLRLDPEREATYRTLIEAYGRNQMFEAAQQSYLAVTEMLKKEHGEAPSIETQAVMRRVSAAHGDRVVEPSRPQAHIQPRIAFLAPLLLGADVRPELLKALIEDVANELSRYRSFAILAPHSSFQVKQDSGIPADNATLRTDFTVSGFATQGLSGDLLVLRLVNCSNDQIVWAGDFPLATEALFTSFRMLSLRIATTLASSLERETLALGPASIGGSAYRHFLDGRNLQRRLTLGHLRRARAAFKEAIEISNTYAAARARIAETLFDEWVLLGAGDPSILSNAWQQTEGAIAADPHNATGHWMAGLISLYRRDFDQAAEKFIEAETLSPNNADLLVEHANALAHFGQPRDGISRFERALLLNPTPPDHYWRTGAGIYFTAGDMANTIDLCGRVTNDECVLRLLAASHALAGNKEAARDYGKRLAEVYPGQTAKDMVGISPDKDPNISEMFLSGLRMAGVK